MQAAKVVMMAVNYRRRVADDELRDRRGFAGAVAIDGPRACGKTMTASRVAATVHKFLADPNLRALAQAAPATLFADSKPILFDEWQVVPNLWNLVKEAADEAHPLKGQFLLTGSATPDDDIDRHSGAGRFSMLRMRPMSLYETGHSTGAVSLRDLFDGNLEPAANRAMDIPALIERLVIGGWPALLDASVPQAQQWLQDYLDTIVQTDLPRLGTRRDPAKVGSLLAALGRGTGTAISVSTLAADVGGPDGPVKWETAQGYLAGLERLLLVEDVPAWNPHMRSATRLRKDPTRYLVDPSLGIAALKQGPEQLLRDLNATGFQFESMVIRDLRVYSQSLRGSVTHWLDKNGHEVDAVLTLGDGRWAAIEVKMGPEAADKAADSLIRFKAKVDTSKVGDPAFMAVVTATGPAHVRADGVMVVPITTLGP